MVDGILGAIGPLGDGFEIDFIWDFCFVLPICLAVFLETLFAFALLLPVFFLAVVFKILSCLGE